MQVWVMERGEKYEGGRVVGIYATRDMARADVLDGMKDLARFRDAAGRAEVEADGSLYMESGCDWLTLTPYEVQGQLELPR